MLIAVSAIAVHTVVSVVVPLAVTAVVVHSVFSHSLHSLQSLFACSHAVLKMMQLHKTQIQDALDGAAVLAAACGCFQRAASGSSVAVVTPL